VVPGTGIEPVCPLRRPRILSPLRLPISPSGRAAHYGCSADERRAPQGSPIQVNSGGAIRSRTGLDGFAIRCITALLSRQGANDLTVFSAKKKGSRSFPIFLYYFGIWSGIRGSNSRPIPWQGIALPTELIPHVLQKKLSHASALPDRLPSRSRRASHSMSAPAAFASPLACRQGILNVAAHQKGWPEAPLPLWARPPWSGPLHRAGPRAHAPRRSAAPGQSSARARSPGCSWRFQECPADP
jgi:hypothetical protein